MLYFDIPMQNTEIMKLFESHKYLGEDFPYVTFLKILALSFVIEYFLE